MLASQPIEEMLHKFENRSQSYKLHSLSPCRTVTPSFMVFIQFTYGLLLSQLDIIQTCLVSASLLVR